MILVKFSLGVLCYLALFQFSLQLSGNRLVALASAAVVMFGATAAVQPWLLIRTYLDPTQATFLQYSRPIHPAGGSIFFFGSLAALFRYEKYRSTLSWFVFALLFGISFYVYLFTWTFLLAYLGLLIIWLVLRRRAELARGVSWAVLLGLGIGSFLLFELWRVIHDVDYTEAAARFGAVGFRYPIIGATAAACALSVLLFRGGRKNLVVPLYLTPLIVLNQQLVTGRSLHTGHYHWYFIVPLFILMGLVLVHQLTVNRGVWDRWVFASFLGLAFMLGIAQQRTAWIRWYQPYVARQSLGETYNWLNRHTPKASVVLAEEYFYLAGYTHNDSYLNTPYSLAPTDRLIDDYYMRRIFFADANRPLTGSRGEKVDMARQVYGGHYHPDCDLVEAKRLDISYTCWDDARLAPLYKRYDGYDRGTVFELARKFRLDYVLMKKPVANPFLEGKPILFENSTYALYRWR